MEGVRPQRASATNDTKGVLDYNSYSVYLFQK
jgi:hypothetical protein